MARSAFAAFVDVIRRRPEWVETDGEREVLVCGYSLLDGALVFLVGLVVLVAAIAMLAVMP